MEGLSTERDYIPNKATSIRMICLRHIPIGARNIIARKTIRRATRASVIINAIWNRVVFSSVKEIMKTNFDDFICYFNFPGTNDFQLDFQNPVKASYMKLIRPKTRLEVAFLTKSKNKNLFSMKTSLFTSFMIGPIRFLTIFSKFRMWFWPSKAHYFFCISG